MGVPPEKPPKKSWKDMKLPAVTWEEVEKAQGISSYAAGVTGPTGPTGPMEPTGVTTPTGPVDTLSKGIPTGQLFWCQDCEMWQRLDHSGPVGTIDLCPGCHGSNTLRIDKLAIQEIKKIQQVLEEHFVTKPLEPKPSTPFERTWIAVGAAAILALFLLIYGSSWIVDNISKTGEPALEAAEQDEFRDLENTWSEEE
jgi:hypothetical protein